MTYEWKDKVVLITGAATAIGAEVVRILMDEQIKHVAVLDINDSPGVSLQNELNAKHGNKVTFYQCDVTNEKQLQGCFEAVADEQGYIDVVVNNAGIMNDSLKTYKKMIDVNLTAVCSGTIKAIEIMSKENGGRGGTVINVSSTSALYHTPPMVPIIYHSTKTASLKFSICMGGEKYYTRNGVRVVALCFGATDTPLTHPENVNFGNFDTVMDARYTKNIKTYHLQKPESAAQGLVDAYKHAESGSTWVASNDRPVKEITTSIKKAFDFCVPSTEQ